MFSIVWRNFYVTYYLLYNSACRKWWSNFLFHLVFSCIKMYGFHTTLKIRRHKKIHQSLNVHISSGQSTDVIDMQNSNWNITFGSELKPNFMYRFDLQKRVQAFISYAQNRLQRASYQIEKINKAYCPCQNLRGKSATYNVSIEKQHSWTA